MSRKGYFISDQMEMHFVTFTVVSWIDIFTKQIYKDILMNNFRYYMKNQGLKVHAYVIMSNHVHAILSASQHKNDLSSIIGRIKSMSSKQIIEKIINGQERRKDWILAELKKVASTNSKNKNYQLWQQHNHPIELDNVEITRHKLNYIHENPVKAAIVNYPEDYVYSSAVQYAGLAGMLKIDFLELGLEK